MNKQKIIIDCDPGIDDAIALAYAAANKENFEILAITTVSGNLPVDTVTRNALDFINLCGLKVPVAKGMSEPLIRKADYAIAFHGENGLGNCILPASPQKEEKENAVFYLHKVLTALPEGERVTLIMTAPMTNIALLFKLYPEVKEKIREIIFMGGAACGGNVTPAAEYNIYTDPEAAKIVFHGGVPLVMCGLDATLKCCLTRHQVLKLCQSNHPGAKLCGDMAGFRLENSSEKYRGVISLHDVAPLMYLLHPEIFTPKKVILDVDCSYGPGAGSVICDFRWWEHEEEEMNSIILMDADTARFQEYLISALYELTIK